jgi:predicted MFS family arabinose efflux permease
MVAYQGLSTMALFMSEELRLPPSAYGFVFAASGLLVTVCELPLTMITSQWSHSRLLAGGAAVTGAGFALITFAHGLGAMFATMAVWTLGEIVMSPAAAARAAELDPAGRRGLALGLYSGAWSASLAIGPMIGTMSLRAFGGRVHWMAVGAVGLAAAVVFAFAPRSESGRADDASIGNP